MVDAAITVITERAAKPGRPFRNFTEFQTNGADPAAQLDHSVLKVDEIGCQFRAVGVLRIPRNISEAEFFVH